VKIGGEFEFDGFWWIPGEGGGAQRAQGRLTYEPKCGVELAVVDLRTDPKVIFEPADPISVLHGFTLQGKPCTLFDVISTSVEHHPYGGHTREVLQSNRLVYGQHLRDIDELLVTDAVVGIRGLQEWANHHWIFPREEGEPEEAAPDLFANDVYNVPIDGGSVLFQRGVGTRSGELARRKMDATVTARFQFDEPMTYSAFKERFTGPLEDLIVLTSHQPSATESVSILIPSEQVKWWGSDRPSVSFDDVSVVERTTVDWQERRPNAFSPIPMPLRAWGDGADMVVARWFSIREHLGGAGDLFFATLNKSHADLEGIS